MCIEDDGFNLGDLKSSGDFVILKVRVEHASGLRVHEPFFEDGLSQPHDDPTINLTLCRQAVNRQSAILNGDDFDDSEFTRFGINFNFSELCASSAALTEFLIPLSTFTDAFHTELSGCQFPLNCFRSVRDNIDGVIADA